MGEYIVLSKLTDEGAKTLKSKPERVKQVNQELEKMGVKVRDQYLTLGNYDFVNIVEADSNIVISKAMMELASRGTIRTTTLPAMKLDDLLESM